MITLAIETSSEACSCALRSGEDTLERYEVAPRRHTELLLTMVEELLAEAGIGLQDIDRFAYGRGPGSFTGVRIAACAVQGLALAADRPVLPVSSLAAAALRGAGGAGHVMAVFDARMGEVYLGAFRIGPDGGLEPAGDEQLAAPGDVVLPDGDGWLGVGAGWTVHGDALAARMAARLAAVNLDVFPGAAQIAAIADASGEHGLPAAQALPVYPKRRVATPRAPRVT